MSQPPYQPPTSWSAEPASQQPWTAEPDVAAAQAQTGPAARRTSRGRALAVGAVAGGVLLIGGAGYAVAAFLSGGGPQPTSVLPRDTLGFVALDLDPSAAQKVAASRLLDRFPALDDLEEDLEGHLLDEWLTMSGEDLTYARDVEPWLGDRMAVAVVPSPGTEGGVAPVLVLAVTDQQAMADALDRVRDDSTEVGFAVRDDFVLVTVDQGLADDLASGEESLEDDADYAADREALGGDQIALAWADLSAAGSVLASDPAFAEATGGLFGGELSGRFILGVHAEDDALEMVGLDFGVSDVGNAGRSDEPTRLAQTLPDDAIAVFAAAGAGEQAVRAWDDFTATGALAGAEEDIARLGLRLPEDLRTVLGEDLAVAVLGDWETPSVGARVVTDDPQRALELVERVLRDEGGVPVVGEAREGGYLVASDEAAADALGRAGALGDSEAFRRAVADADEAVAIGYLDVAAVLAQWGPPAGEGFGPEDLEPVEAVGLSSTWTDEGGRFVLRITVR